MGLERRRDTCDDIFFHYLNQYLTFEALDSGTFTLTIGSGVSTSLLTSVSYSIDSGSTWTTTNNITNTQVVITTPTIAQGNKVLWKGIGTAMSNSQLVFGTASANRLPLASNFTSSGRYKISGNIMSLLYGDNFLVNKEFANGSSHNFALLFYKGSADSKLVSAKNMIFPARKCPIYAYFRIFQMNSGLEYSPVISATEVHSYGCANMFYKCSSLKTSPNQLANNLVGSANYMYAFYNCTSLTKAPELPATTVPTSGYAYTFYGCTSFTETPEFPATTLFPYCYYAMFIGCTSLTSVSELPVNTLAERCYYGMFGNCTSLVTAPELPATVLAPYCYGYMFDGCSSLKNIPDLPAKMCADYCYYCMFYNCTSLESMCSISAETLSECCYYVMFAGCTSLVNTTPLNVGFLSEGCYAYMFSGCTSLTVAPELPSTSLISWCYGHMFEGCTSLVNAPLLPATKLVSACYRTMFGGCTNLRYVKCLAEDLGQSESSNPLLSWMSGVPSGGTFYKMNGVTWPSGANGIPTGWNVVEINGYDEQYFTFKALESGTFTLTIPSALTTTSLSSVSYSVDNGNTWVTTNNVNNTEIVITTPVVSQGYKILWKGSGTQYANSSSSSRFTSTAAFDVYGNSLSLFRGDNFIGYTAIGNGGQINYYLQALFYGNTNLVNAEHLILPTNHGLQCMNSMFNGCTSLISAPAIPASTVYQSSQANMFKGCTSLTKAPDLLASSIGARSYNSMFSGCTSLNYVKCLATSRSTNNPIAVWLAYVSPTGTFVKAQSATDWPSGGSGIPTGWTVINDSSNGINEYSYIQNGLVFQLDGINRGTTDLTKWVDLIGNQEYVTVSGDNATWGEDHLITPCEMFVADNEVIKTSGSTFEIVFYESTGSVNTILYINRNTSTTLGFGFGRYGANYLLTNNSGYRLTIPLTTAPFGNTYCFSYNGDSLLVVNGQKITNTGTVDYYLNNTNNTRVAQRGNGGKLYCIRKYNRKLTEAEMIYNQQIDNIRFNLNLNM